MELGLYGNVMASGLASTLGSINNYPQTHNQHTVDEDAVAVNSFLNLVMGEYTLNDVMADFRRNGIDYPYDPEEEAMWKQKPIESVPVPTVSKLTQQQLYVINSLPDPAIFELLQCLNPGGPFLPKRSYRAVECRFCKNNGERETYYRSHNLKDLEGRVLCPVLRAFVCRRCGASGDNAHTIKYCPRSSDEERIKSTAMLRTVRMASGRRRTQWGPRELPAPAAGGYLPPSQLGSVYSAYQNAPLDPHWAALEQKLLSLD